MGEGEGVRWSPWPSTGLREAMFVFVLCEITFVLRAGAHGDGGQFWQTMGACGGCCDGPAHGQLGRWLCWPDAGETDQELRMELAVVNMERYLKPPGRMRWSRMRVQGE